MFRLSQKADYGLILLSSLARAKSLTSISKIAAKHKISPKFLSQIAPSSAKATEGKSARFVSVSKVAKKHGISVKFLSQIAQDLKKAGILTSKEGIAGGYTLAKNANQIKLLDVLKILEGELLEGKCFEEGHECTCGAGEMWQEMKKQMEATMGTKTVADLVAR